MDYFWGHVTGPLNLATMVPNSLEIRLSRKIKEARRSRGWSLAEFESKSCGAIKAGVLGSYERGTRSVSVRKLELIANTLEVPVGFLLGFDAPEANLSSELMIDIRKVKALGQSGPVERYFHQILAKRGDWNGEILTLRTSDLEILALINESDKKMVSQYLRSQRYLLEPELKS